MIRVPVAVGSGAMCAALLALLTAVARGADGDVELKTATGTIYGTLTMPKMPSGPVHVVLIIAGSGPTDRDGNSILLPGKSNVYLQLAAALAARGIASVRYDKRGVGASSAALAADGDLRFDNYVDDAAAWVSMLHADPRFSQVVIAGHSQGSLVGLIAAQRGGAAAVVSLEGAGRPAATILREQLKTVPPDVYAQIDAILTSLQDGKTISLSPSTPQYLRELFRLSTQPYDISWFRFDPAVEIAKLSVPVIIVQGTSDVQVTQTDAQALAKADPKATTVVVPGMNHVLKHAPDTSSETAVMAGYTDPSLQVDPAVVQAIADACNAAAR